MTVSPPPAAQGSVTNHSLQVVAAHERVFAWHNHAALWFSLGVGLLVLQMGALIAPALGFTGALWVIAGGSLLGAALLAWVAHIGATHGLASAGLMHAVMGRRFAQLPVLLNIVQLLGWGAFELVVMREATVAIVSRLGWIGAGTSAALWATLAWGALLTLLMTLPMVRLVRQLIARVALPLVVLALLWISWQLLGQAHTQGWAALTATPGNGSMSRLSALDLVIAMPVSWLPLVADYARHGRSAKGAFWGTWAGFALANAWCYGLGVLIATLMPGTEMMAAVLLVQGGLLALALVLLDEVDNAYGDTYSAAMSAHSLLPRRSVRHWAVVVALACTVLAIVLQMHSLEPFLILLSSVFTPLFGVIVGSLAGRRDVAGLLSRAPAVNGGAVAIWLLGIGGYHALAQWAPHWGSALPAFALTLGLSALLRVVHQPAAARSMA
ncbi:allantoin permease [Comamonas serinivorans]|uniref:Allantoin permease n=1 Tax=Comamonas serinivorans TaxID=1082851 RepID=A0A1Y0ETB7_9BURK|nr:cytosine permease [Comamonas serinivorans]ARU06778.1 allantoin permease [Comamonas serinivorans]